MIYLLVFIFLLQIIVISTLVKDVLFKMYIFSYITWWNVNLIISCFNFYSLYPVSNSTYYLLILNVGFFFLGFVLFDLLKKKHSELSLNHNGDSKLKSISNHCDTLIKSKLYKTTLFILAVVLFCYLVKYLNLLNQVGPSQARTLRYFVGGLFSSQAEMLIFNYFLEPLNYIIIGLISIFIVFNKYKNVFFVLLLSYFILFTSVGSGRTALIELLVFTLYAMYYRISIKTISKNSLYKFFKYLFLFLVLFVLVIGYSIYLTALRLGMKNIEFEIIVSAFNYFFESIIVYCNGAFRALDYALNNYSNLIGFKYGLLAFSGFDELLGTYFWSFNVDYDITNHFIGGITNAQISVGPGMLFNALYTCVFNFYFDFGIIGVVVYAFIFGLTSSYILHLLRRYNTVKLYCLSSLMYVVSIFSVQKWYFQSGSFIILSVVLFFWINFKIINKIILKFKPVCCSVKFVLNNKK